jgi:rare lipoprotein A
LPRLLTAWWFALALLLMSVPAAGAASGSADAGTGGTAPPQPQTGPPPPADTPAGDMDVDAPRSAFVRRRVRIGGKSRRARRKVVRIEGRLAGGAWTTLVRARADRKGVFSAVWKPRRTGQWELRARIGPSATGTNGGTSVPVEIGPEGSGASSHLTVYESAIATWYGPGFFGRQTACGIELTETTVGVAHRELPCGTQVQIALGDRVIVVPVIDRGPFANGADWDLTQAAAQQLGMTGTSRIGAMPLGPDR